MRRIPFAAALLPIMGAALMAATSAKAAVTADLANGENIFKNGKGEVPACSSCHGEKGMGNDSLGTPRLSGQVYQFLRKQLEDFATDKREDKTMFVMNANAKGLTPQDRTDVAAFLSTREDTPEHSNLEELKANGTDTGVTYEGKAIVNFGDVKRGISACQSCHGYNGRGRDPVYPQLNGQKFVYLTNQLRNWRDGSRANDPLAQMRKIAQHLTDADIANVANYLSHAPLTTAGNPRIPERHLPFAH